MRAEHWLYTVPLRLRSLFRRRQVERELDEELRDHVARQAEENVARGMTPEAARRAALVAFGGVERHKEAARDVRGVGAVEELGRDLRYAARALRRSPGFAAVAALTLALGIGANTAIFSVVHGVLLSPLPYREPGRLVMLWESMKNLPQIMVSYPNFLDWRRRAHVFEDIAIYNGFDSFTQTGMGDAERVRGGLASANLFDVFGVTAALGRTFRPADDRTGAERVALISDGFWQRRFAADPSAVGRPITLDGNVYTIVGVLPPRWRLAGAEVWLPIGLFGETPRFAARNNHPGTIGVGRLKPHVTIAEMRADLAAVARGLEQDYPRENAGVSASGAPLTEMVVGEIRPALLVLAGAVGLVLLIACANVANLLLGRAAARQREIALRIAIGAGRGRIVRQLLTESVVLALVGGVLGVALAWAGVKLLLALRPSNVPRLMDIHIDAAVLAFALALSVVTGVLFGLAPALQSARGDLLSALKEGGRGASAGRAPLRLRSALMVAEVALAVVLLVGAGLLVRSFAKLTRVDPGVDPRNVVAALVSLPRQSYPDSARQRAAFDALLERAKALPQVTDAALSSDLPITSSWQLTVTFEGLPPVTPGSEPLLNGVVTSPEWFRTMRMPLLAGRGFERADETGPPVVVISEAVARRFYKGANPVGRRLKHGSATGDATWVTIVGVVRDTRNAGMASEPYGTIYYPATQEPLSSAWLAVRSAAPPERLVPQMRKALAAVDPNVPLASVQTLDQAISDSLAQPKFSTLMLGIFAAVALLLAAIGIYGVIAYAVAQRRHEIGVRIALGAARADVVGMVVRQVMTLAAAGLLIGGAAALAGGRLIATLLFDVRPADPLTFAGVAALLASVALAAASIPALRAARVDPMVALRGE